MSVISKKCFPFLFVFLTAILLSLCEASVSIVFAKYFFLVSTLVCFVFYFSVFNPHVLNVVVIFILGLFLDFLLYYPFGFQSIVLLLTSFFARFYRRSIVSLSFCGQWIVFLLVLSVVYLFVEILLFTVSEKSVSVMQFFVNYIFLCVLYPFISCLCAFINRKIGVSK